MAAADEESDEGCNNTLTGEEEDQSNSFEQTANGTIGLTKKK